MARRSGRFSKQAVVTCLDAFTAAGLTAADLVSCLAQPGVASAVRALLKDGAENSPAETAAEQAGECLRLHGYTGATVQPLCAGAAASAAAVTAVGEAAQARGELVVPASHYA